MKEDATWWERLTGFAKSFINLGALFVGIRWLTNPKALINDVRSVLKLFYRSLTKFHRGLKTRGRFPGGWKGKALGAVVTETEDTIRAEILAVQTLVSDAQATARDIRTDIKSTVNQQLDQIDAIDKRSRADGLETRQAMRNTEKEVRELIIDTSQRWDDKLTKVDSQIEALEAKIDKKITKALENPLAAMTKTK